MAIDRIIACFPGLDKRNRFIFRLILRRASDIILLLKGEKTMNSRIGISTAAFYGMLETEDAAEAISRVGCGCAEVFLQSESEYTPEFAREVKKRLGAVRCTSIHVTATQTENAFFARSVHQREDARRQLDRTLEAGAILGAERYVYHGRNTPRLTALPFRPEENARVYEEMSRAAAEHGMVIAWENVFWCQLTSPERVRIMRGLLPRARFTLDIKQAKWSGFDALAFVPAMGEALCNVHLCDWDADGHLCLPGQGVFDFRAFFRALDGAGYRGPLILEPYSSLLTGEEDLRQAAAYLSECLA